jgi:hypothetical protein
LGRLKETQKDPFSLKGFFDQLNNMGNIPMALGHWQMTVNNNHIRQLMK